MYESNYIYKLIFSHLQMHLWQTTLENNVEKGEISLFATMYSIKKHLKKEIFHIFDYAYKGICCRFDVCGQRLTLFPHKATGRFMMLIMIAYQVEVVAYNL